MVLEALRIATRGDSATSRPSLRNRSITSFFSPLSATATPDQRPKTASEIHVDAKLNSLEWLGNSSGVVKPPSRHRPSTPPSPDVREPVAKKRKTTPPRTYNITQSRNSRNGALARHSPASQASVTRSDTTRSRGQTQALDEHGKVKTSQETRTLRSKEKALYKSDLALYFANYEDILMDNAPIEAEFLRVEEPIHIVDEPASGSAKTSPEKSKTTALPARTRPPTILRTSTPGQGSSSNGPSPAHAQPDADAKTIHLLSPARDNSTADPLSDDVYATYHARRERKEKQLRNIEKERAQHEKAHLERLLEGLHGPDWLRVLGVSGITEGEQNQWKPKRNYFIKEVNELVEKFQRWKDAERRLRLKKEREREAEMENEEDSDDSDASAGANSSDLDASAAYQLLQEAGQTPKKAAPQPRRPKANHVLWEAPPSPEQPFAGFYKEAHLRAQALGEVRHGRTNTAFGVELPHPPEEEFKLWPDLTEHDSRRERERKRRKLKQEAQTKREFL